VASAAISALSHSDAFVFAAQKQREELIRLKESHAREQSRVKEEHASEMRRQASALSRAEAELAALQLSTKETISKLEGELDGTQHELGNARAELRSLRSKVERLETPDRDAVRRKRAEELERLVAEERMEGSSKRLRTG
jgi:peptidoglycan hydrolase CwlO-like protein